MLQIVCQEYITCSKIHLDILKIFLFVELNKQLFQNLLFRVSQPSIVYFLIFPFSQSREIS